MARWQDVIMMCLYACVCVSAAYFNDIIVGAVCSREEKVEGQKRLYIMTLGCLAPYRRLGIGLFLFIIPSFSVCRWLAGVVVRLSDL